MDLILLSSSIILASSLRIWLRAIYTSCVAFLSSAYFFLLLSSSYLSSSDCLWSSWFLVVRRVKRYSSSFLSLSSRSFLVEVVYD
jgi:hypothetical protein